MTAWFETLTRRCFTVALRLLCVSLFTIDRVIELIPFRCYRDHIYIVRILYIFSQELPLSRFNLSLSAVAVSVLLCACDSSTFTAESTEIDIVPILDSDGNILNLLTPRQVTVASCDRSAYSIRSATSPYDFDDNFAPAKAIDGSLSQTSRWSSKGIGRSITFDLGAPNLVNRIQTAWVQGQHQNRFL